MIQMIANKPTIRSGRFSAGADFVCGANVVVDVADEVVVGDRCVLADDTYICGMGVRIGDDFFNYGHWNKRLEIGLGRRDEEEATLVVGDRNTWHDNRVDLSAPVVIGNDVGLSPETCIYTHHYWLSVLEGYPQRVQGVTIGDGVIVGFRSCVLPGARIGNNAVIGAQSVVSGMVVGGKVWGGNPLRMLKESITPYPSNIKAMLLKQFVQEWEQSLKYRKLPVPGWGVEHPIINVDGCMIDVEAQTLTGLESELTDDLRLFLFKRGIRIFTLRPFAKLGRAT